MIFRLTRLLRQVRRRREVGAGILLLILIGSIVGNALTFFFFDRGVDPERAITLADAFWYSIVSITTIGYGDFSATSLGARIGTGVFVVFVGLAAFTSAVGIGVDWILEMQYRERSGMGSPRARNHLLIVNFPNERRVRQIIGEFLRDPRHRDDEIVIVTDQIETLPFTVPNVHFVRGSPLEEETYRRAGADIARQAIVLSTGYDDPNTDSVAASIVSLLEHVNPQISSVAECLNVDHSLLFQGAKNVSLAYTFRISNNLMVQEAQDPGVNKLTHAITSNEIEGTLVSTKVAGDLDPPRRYSDVAKILLDHDVNLVGVIRGESVRLLFDQLEVAKNDRLVYICLERYDWETLRSFLGRSR